MLIEYVGPQNTERIPVKGVDYRFVPNPQYDNARVVDVVDPETIAYILKQTGLGKQQWYRRYPLDALRDPDFLRAIDSNPEAARFRLNQIERGEVEIDLEQLEWQLTQTEPVNLKVYAELRGIDLGPTSHKPFMIKAILDHYRKPSVEAKAEPRLVVRAEKREQKRARGRPRGTKNGKAKLKVATSPAAHTAGLAATG